MESTENLPKRSRWGRRVAVLAICVLCMALFHHPLLVAVASVLTVPRQPLQPNVLIIGGDGRYEIVAEAIQEGIVHRVLISPNRQERLQRLGILPSDVELAKRELAKAGIAESYLELLPEPTADQPIERNLAEWCQEHPNETISVICSEFSAREKQWIFSQVIEDHSQLIFWYPLESKEFNTKNWYRRKHGILNCFGAYFANLFLRIHGGGIDTYEELDPDAWLKTKVES